MRTHTHAPEVGLRAATLGSLGGAVKGAELVSVLPVCVLVALTPQGVEHVVWAHVLRQELLYVPASGGREGCITALR